MKKILCLICVLTVFFSGAVFAGGQQDAGEDQVTIAYTTMGFDSPYWVEVARGVEDAAKDMGWKALIHDAKGNVSSQIDAMENWINMDVDFIITSVLDSAAMAPKIKEAMDAGIGVIGQSTITEGQILREGPVQEDLGDAVGQGAGKWAKDNMSGKLKGVTYFVQADPQTIIREEAMRTAFEEHYPNVEWINDPGTIDSLTLEDGINNFEGIIQKHPDINVVLSCCDDGLVGSYEVAKSSGMDLNDMVFGGINALPQVLEMMKEEKETGYGAYRVTVDSEAYLCGRECVEVIAAKYLAGETLKDAYWVPAKAVTWENIDNYFDASGELTFGSEAYRKANY